MKPWNDRPKEVANLLNPAFCTLLLTSSVLGYYNANSRDMPFPIAYMILPIILHEPSRKSLPKRVNKSLPSWINENFWIRMLFSERVLSLKPFTEESILFGLSHEWLLISEKGNIKSNLKKTDLNNVLNENMDNLSTFVERSNFLGRWFGKMDAPQTIMALWGIRP